MGVKNWLEAPVAGVAGPWRSRLNLVRGAVARVTTPLLPDDYLHLANPLWSARELRGRIVEVRKETADSATLVIKPGWGFDFDYRPGQYVGIGVHVDGRWHWRSYSLTSSPVSTSSRSGQHKFISIAVKAMPEGFLSSHLVGGVPSGTVVRLAAPKGDFALPEPPPAKVLFLTAGSGITPVISMLRTMVARDDVPDVVHVHSAPTVDDVMFGAELRDIEAEYASFVSRVHLTRSQGKFALGALDSDVPDWRERETWACGPAAMLDEIEQHWADAELSGSLHLERFEIARADGTAQGGTVTFAKSERTQVVDGATTLLQAGEQAGVQMPFGCRMGICQTCVVPLTDGCVRDLRSGAEHRVGDRVQTCISVAAGDCTLDL